MNEQGSKGRSEKRNDEDGGWPLSAGQILPDDGTDGVLIGRIWRPGPQAG